MVAECEYRPLSETSIVLEWYTEFNPLPSCLEKILQDFKWSSYSAAIDSADNASCNPRPPMLNIPWAANVDDLLGKSAVINAGASVNEPFAYMPDKFSGITVSRPSSTLCGSNVPGSLQLWVDSGILDES
jgi:hypothetical protein